MEKNLNPLPAQGRDPFCSHSNTPFEGWATPGQRRGPGRPSHLVRGCLTLLDAYGILFVVGKHDQANEAAYAEDQLLAREDRIAGAAKEARVKGSGGLTDTSIMFLSPRRETHGPPPPHCFHGTRVAHSSPDPCPTGLP